MTNWFSCCHLTRSLEEFLIQHSELSGGLPMHWHIEIHINLMVRVLEKLAMFGYKIKKKKKDRKVDVKSTRQFFCWHLCIHFIYLLKGITKHKCMHPLYRSFKYLTELTMVYWIEFSVLSFLLLLQFLFIYLYFLQYSLPLYIILTKTCKL